MNAMAPSFRRDLNIATTWFLPSWSTGPVGDQRAALEAAREAGYQGIQGVNAELCREFDLVATTFDVRPTRGGLVESAMQWADQGFACTTLLLGTGMEDDDEAGRMIEEVLEATSASGMPIYVETHRATLTQDSWRTLELVKRFPEIRFNGDFSHWYTGHEMTMSKFEEKLDWLAPVFERVRYLHGRIGTSGCMQVDVGDGRVEGQDHVGHFRSMWERSFAGFLNTVEYDMVPPPRMEIGFAPELLPAEFGYALCGPGEDGSLQELGDRWAQGLVLTRIAAECFEAAAS